MSGVAASRLVPKIIFEDPFVLILDKPAGLVVNRAESVKGITLQDWLAKKINFSQVSPGSNFQERNGLVHRLDKQTSGVILVAKTPQALEILQNQFRNRQVVKKYLALVHGWVEPQTGEIDLPISRNRFQRKKFGVFLGGKKSITNYQTISRYNTKKIKGKYFSLLELIPKTGRTHQLRVHLKYLNHPIVADPIYAGRKTYRNDLKWCPRLFLHATFIAFFHPQTGKLVSFTADLPEELNLVLKKLTSVR